MNRKNGKREAVGGKGLKLFALYSLLFTLHALGFTLPFLDAAPYHSITVDGDLSEWPSAEIIVSDGEDSAWDPGTGKNEIKNIYATWDASNIYIGAEGAVDGKGIIVYIDSGGGGGFADIREINTWNRRARFSGWSPDYFYAAWDGSAGNFYRIASSFTAEDVSGQCSMASIKSGSRPGWEIRIPFDLLYSKGNMVPPAAQIKVCAALATGDTGSADFGDYGYLGGDTAPDNTVTGLTDSVLTAFAVIEMDKNSDGVPDDSYAGAPLSATDVSVDPVRFAPALHREASVTLNINKRADTTAVVYDIAGNRIKTLSASAAPDETKKVFLWDGARDDGSPAHAGVYIVNIRVSAGSESARINKAVVLIR